jgi:hypothetical protein
MIGFIGTSLQIQQLTISNSLRLSPFLPRLRVSLFLHSKRRVAEGIIKKGSTIDHCRSRCKGQEGQPLIHSFLHCSLPLWRITNEGSLATEQPWSELSSRRTEYTSSPKVRVLLCFIVATGMCLASRWLTVEFRVCSSQRERVLTNRCLAMGIHVTVCSKWNLITF